jgi:hypothetical protein
MNDDRFIMEKISQTLELDDKDDIWNAIDFARRSIEQNFRIAYPKVEEHLNFYVVIQPTDIAKEYIEQKINKGTIEEQIEACTTVDELNSFTLIAGMNKKYQEQYHRKLKELTV